MSEKPFSEMAPQTTNNTSYIPPLMSQSVLYTNSALNSNFGPRHNVPLSHYPISSTQSRDPRISSTQANFTQPHSSVPVTSNVSYSRGEQASRDPRRKPMNHQGIGILGSVPPVPQNVGFNGPPPPHMLNSAAVFVNGSHMRPY